MIISPKQLFWHVLIIKQYEGKYAYIHTYTRTNMNARTHNIYL